MRILPSGSGFMRMLIQIAHWQWRDVAKRNSVHLWRKINKWSLRFPYMLQIEVTNDCILECIMCPHSQLEEKTGYMSFEQFGKIIDECSRHYSLGELVFSGMGEPLLHPQILEMSKLAKSKGIPKVRMTTNALLLTEQRVGEILEDSRLDQISFSLDALTPETYRKIKGSSNFAVAQNNIIYFLEQKHKKNQWKPFVNLHILKMKETVSEIDGFMRQWKPLLGKGDNILVKALHNFAGQVEDRRLEEHICDGRRFPCRQLWEFLYISWNGDVMPCCMDVLKKLRIGNFQESSLEALWNDPLLQEIREIHLQGQYGKIPLCSQCSNWWYLTKRPK